MQLVETGNYLLNNNVINSESVQLSNQPFISQCKVHFVKLGNFKL